MLNEENIIGYLKSQFRDSASIIGIGDDAAIFPKNEQESYVISKDLLVEEQHFRLRYYDAATLAQKVLQVNLSDIAAMGAKPHSVLLGLAIPPTLSENWLNTFLESFVEACKENRVILLGGDTTASSTHLFISATVIGEAPNANLKRRNTAQVGDVVCVAGQLGEAHTDLLLLEKNLRKTAPMYVQAKVQEGLWFGNHPEVHAMMDISDGLYLDLSRLCEASQVGAEVVLDGIIPSRELIEACAVLTLDPLQCMLVGGEDYGLLVTIDPHQYEPLAAAFLKKFGYSLARVGTITQHSGIRLIQNNQEVPMIYRPFSHFGEL
jgi:thiamine-monophosphate kinase